MARKSRPRHAAAPAGEARARATVLVSGLRGVALDRYVTGDAARADAAAALLIDQATAPDRH